MVEQDKSEVDALENENESLKAKISELENQVKQFRENNDSLMRDLETYKSGKLTLQQDNAKLERENTELAQRIEGLLNENKGTKSECRMLRSRVEEIEEQMSRVQASAVSCEEDHKTQAAESVQSEVRSCDSMCDDRLHSHVLFSIFQLYCMHFFTLLPYMFYAYVKLWT